LFQLGYFIEDFMEHNFLKPKTNDFWEMNFHHFLTITLFGGMIVTNTIALGSFVSFLHNVSDIPMTLTRILSNTVFKNTTYICFGFSLIVWIITRNIMLPLVSYECWLGHVYPPELS
jgi:TLC domain